MAQCGYTAKVSVALAASILELCAGGPVKASPSMAPKGFGSALSGQGISSTATPLRYLCVLYGWMHLKILRILVAFSGAILHRTPSATLQGSAKHLANLAENEPQCMQKKNLRNSNSRWDG